MYCSAGSDLVCQGREPIPGCGAVLEADERHYYGSVCDNCEREWSRRIGLWQHGTDDTDFDAMFKTRDIFHG